MSGRSHDRGPNERPARYVAYVYPGWHHDSYRPGVDEWQLLDTFKPYFPGHLPPAQPLDGPYDDTDPRTAARQIQLATTMGIEAFTYFTYYGPTGFVMAEPMTLALESSAVSVARFSIGGTLCIRLPHDRFPVQARDELDVPAVPVVTPGTSLDDTPIEVLTLRDLETLLGPNALEWIEIALDGPRSPRQPFKRADTTVPGDSGGDGNG